MEVVVEMMLMEVVEMEMVEVVEMEVIRMEVEMVVMVVVTDSGGCGIVASF